MQGLVSVLVGALIAFPVRAFAEGSDGYPRVVERGDLVCLQRLAVDGKVIEECRERVLAPAAAPAAEAPKPSAAPAPAPAGEPDWIAQYRQSFPEPARPKGNPVDVAKAQAEEDANGGLYLGGALVGGCMLGVLGCGGVTLLGMTSDPTPPDLGRWGNSSDEVAYRLAYKDEIRSIRTRNALIGGAIGAAITVALVIVVVTQMPTSSGGGVDD
jgi:hypothetical protein